MHTKQVIADMYVDREAGIPLHYQIRVGIEKCVEKGLLNEGDRLPNIIDISRLLNVSHATALKAITELQRKGLIISKRGVGTIVAPRRQGATDIIISSETYPPIGTQGWDFHHQIMDGLNEGFDDPDRILTMMYMGDSTCSPNEFLASIRARRVDSVIAYNPSPNLHPLLNSAGRDMPVVSLCGYIPNSPVHCIAPEVEPLIKDMIQRRIDAGQRDFIYLNDNIPYGRDAKPFNPYRSIHDTFCETLKDVGITAEEITIQREYPCRGDIKNDLRRPNGNKVDPGTTLLLKSPAIFDCFGAFIEDMDLITYTESQLSYDMLLNRASFIYFGLEQAAIEATELIINREVPGVGERGRVIRPKPKVFDLIDVEEEITLQ